MQIKHFFKTITILTFLTLPTCSQGAQPDKVGYVDIEKITAKALFVRDMVGDIEKRIREERDSLDLLQEQYVKLSEELKRKESILSEQEIENRLKETRRLKSDMEEQQYKLNRTLREAEKKQMEPALDLILETIRNIGKQEGYSLIIRGEIVIYANEQIDISDLVIEKLDQTYKAKRTQKAKKSDSSDDSDKKQKSNRAPALEE